MGISQISKKSISNEVLEQIKTQVISGEWSPGTKIPGELELAKVFDVSRVSIREAIHRLAGMGVLNVKHGEGTYVSEILPGDYFNTLLSVLMIEKDDLMDILEFRSAVEVQSARLASMRADAEDVRRLEEIIHRMRDSQKNKVEFANEDLNFHTALALASHNTVIIKVTAIIHEMLKVAMEKIVSVTGYKGGLYYHAKILEAIKTRDKEKAMNMMQEHINTTIDKMRGVTF